MRTKETINRRIDRGFAVFGRQENEKTALHELKCGSGFSTQTLAENASNQSITKGLAVAGLDGLAC